MSKKAKIETPVDTRSVKGFIIFKDGKEFTTTMFDNIEWNSSNASHFKRLMAEFYGVTPADVFDIFNEMDKIKEYRENAEQSK